MEIVKTVCGMCGNDTCGIEVIVEDHRVVRIKGNPEMPLNDGRLCVQSQAAMELLADPNRLSYPLRRDGDAWQRITWDEALDTIAERLLAVKARYGAHAFALWEGAPMWQFIRDGWDRRLLDLFGSPNWVYHDHMCYLPSVIAEKLTYGRVQVDGFEPECVRCVVLWGSNPATSHNPYQWSAVLEARRRGATLIVVDPRRSEPATKADLHLAIRPGTDGALALGLIRSSSARSCTTPISWLAGRPASMRWRSGPRHSHPNGLRRSPASRRPISCALPVSTQPPGPRTWTSATRWSTIRTPAMRCAP